MASYEGNRLPAPGVFSGTPQADPVEILYSEVNLFVKGGTLKPGQGVVQAGAGLEFETASGQYVVATDAATVEGFNRYATDTGVAGTTSPLFHTVIVLGGKCKADKLSVGGTALDDTSGAAVATALNGRYIASRKVLEF